MEKRPAIIPPTPVCDDSVDAELNPLKKFYTDFLNRLNSYSGIIEGVIAKGIDYQNEITIIQNNIKLLNSHVNDLQIISNSLQKNPGNQILRTRYADWKKKIDDLTAVIKTNQQIAQQKFDIYNAALADKAFTDISISINADLDTLNRLAQSLSTNLCYGNYTYTFNQYNSTIMIAISSIKQAGSYL
jgi:archaellum component FlaC